MKIVVLGNAQTGLVFVGPFTYQEDADTYSKAWKAAGDRATIAVGVITLADPDAPLTVTGATLKVGA